MAKNKLISNRTCCVVARWLRADHYQDPPCSGSTGARFFPSTDRTIVILPFADYTGSEQFKLCYLRSRMIIEALTDEFTAKGIRLPVQESVFNYLVQKKYITLVNSNTADSVSNSLENVLASNWSPKMKTSIREVITLHDSWTSERKKASNQKNTPGVHGLDKKAGQTLGKEFGADYLLRGRIIEYSRPGTTWEPIKIGALSSEAPAACC